jgi:ribosomal protein L11 methyltransferase
LASYPALDIFYLPSPDNLALLDLVYAELDAFEPSAIQDHESGDGVRVFFRRAEDRAAARSALQRAFGQRLTRLEPLDVDDEDWARRSQAGIAAVRAGRIVIAPPWDPAAAGVNAQRPTPNSQSSGFPAEADANLVIVIEPSMGFGTGHHATTRLCLELLQELDLAGRSVIDVGTGSGVLAIAAARLGAVSVVGIDNDPDALQNARENVDANGVTDIVALREADLSALDIPSADVVLANVTAAVIARYAALLRALAARGGHLIVSGFAPDELAAVSAAVGVPVARARRDGDWCAAVLLM